MNITCLICSDVIIPSAELYATQCGHLFHYLCLIQWIGRSKTCPQCRNKATETTIHRIYLNLANTDHIEDDAATLQNKLDNLQFQLSLKEKDTRSFRAKYEKVKNQSALLREEIVELEKKTRVHDSVVHALKDQISFFKSKSKEGAELAQELTKLKMKLKHLESVELAVHGTREEVNEMLKNENEVESLAILVATLKKALLDAEKKKLSIEHKFKQLQNESTKYRKEAIFLESSNRELRKEIELTKTHWTKEKDFLTNVVKEIQEKQNDDNVPRFERIVFESPVPLPKESLEYNSDLNRVESPSVCEKVVDILQSDSPYFCVKTNATGVGTSHDISECIRSSTGVKQMSIFKRPTKNLGKVKPRAIAETVYNGLGGQNKEDFYPSLRASPLGVKRHRTDSSVHSTKARKIAAPLSSKKL